MAYNWIKRRVWPVLTAVHADVRVVAFLRAVAVVGIFGGFAGFMAGLNPFGAVVVIEYYDPDGDTLARIGITGLFVHLTSALYFYATAPADLENGMINY